ncbi:tetratricopeptide repeat protein [Nioella nitratireducens]|uniref:tetratricopeptide repeat protein n=1 Tax=Nioella nitratireducens TaxID=1287720 RepID=UPI0008FD5DA9|nr:tetratricopeptide repeat protein [Nioella nitratireducens]
MANTDSFIEEVNEELRRDRLFALFRKWGWIPILIILVIVGAAAYREYSMAQDRAAAQAFGDEVIAALDSDEPAAALARISPENPDAQVLLTLLSAGQTTSDTDQVTAAAQLRTLADRPDLAARYRDLALLKAYLMDPQDPAQAMTVLEGLSQPGRPYRPLAIEQQALLHVSLGETDQAIALLRVLEEDSQATPGLQQRASQLIVALESGATLADAAPQEAVPATDAAAAQGDAADGTGGAPAATGTDGPSQ